MKKGFTLIELLVVVLIIGILTAIALPQYKAAVLKSRTLPLLNVMRSVMEAEEEYVLSGSNATTSKIIADTDALSVDLPGYEKSCENRGNYQLCRYIKGNTRLVISEVNSYIVALINDSNGNEILSMNMLSRVGQELTQQGYANSDWADKTARMLCEYPESSSQAAAAATVCKSICGGKPLQTGRGNYHTCYFN